MSIESAVYTRLAGYAGVSALVGTRIYPLYLPQTPTYPCIAYRKQDATPISLLSADTNIIESRFEIGSFSNTFDQMISLENEVRLAMQRLSGTVDSMVIMDTTIVDMVHNYEADLEIHESTVTVRITHRV